MKKLITILVLLFAAITAASAVDLDFDGVPAKKAYESLLRSEGKNYSISADVTSNISAMHAKDLTLDAALKALAKSSDTMVRLEDNIYYISAKPTIDIIKLIDVSPEPTLVEKAPVVTVEAIPLLHTTPSDLLAVLKGENILSSTPDKYFNSRKSEQASSFRW